MGPPSRIAVVVKGYPRLSETFIAQELLGPRGARPRPSDRLAAPPDRSRRSTTSIARSRRRCSICRNICTRSRCACCAPGGGCGARRTTAQTRGPVALGPVARPHGQPGAPLRPGPGAGRRDAGRDRRHLRALCAHAGVGRALCRRDRPVADAASRRMPRTSGRRPPGSCARSFWTANGPPPAPPAVPRICAPWRREPRSC